MTEKYITHSYGILYAQEGNSYYLLKPSPIDKYPWQLDCQQMWYVVCREWKVADVNSVDCSDYRPVGYAHQLVTTYPTIEFLPEDIEVETVGLDENDKEDELSLKYEMEALFKVYAEHYAEHPEDLCLF